MRLIWNCEEA